MLHHLLMRQSKGSLSHLIVLTSHVYIDTTGAAASDQGVVDNSDLLQYGGA